MFRKTFASLVAVLALTVTLRAEVPPVPTQNHPTPPPVMDPANPPKEHFEYVMRHGCKYKKITCYVVKVKYEEREEAYTKCITRYDECGKPYVVKKTCYRTIEVPVKYVVPVVKYVKVCH
jgi:hypothetical protein